jgi:hypothetical protein
MAKSLVRAAMCAVVALLPAAALAGVDSECTAGGSATTPDDVTRALLACETARARYAELFGESPAVHIVLRDAAEYEIASVGGTGIVFWPNTEALGGPAAGEARRQAWLDAQWTEVLPHEVMHALTMAGFYSEGGADSHGGYGTPLPDWFEEGIAIWAEPEASRSGRLRQAQALPAERRQLFKILAGEHPVAANAALLAPQPGATVPRDEALRAFYPQAFAVLSFVFDAGGAAAVRELGQRLVRNPADTRALLRLPGLPAAEGELANAWDRWLLESPSASADQR